MLFALAVAPVGFAAACTGTPGPAPTPTGVTTTEPPPDPLADHLAAERRLLGSYQATIAQHPALAKRLAPLRDDHSAHVAALEQEMGLTPSATPTATGTGTATASPTPEVTGIPPVPATAPLALLALKNAEHAAATARAAGCLTADDTAAPLLASIAACESSHEVVLS